MSTTLQNAHALIVGIADYQHINKLPDIILGDARAVHDLLISPKHCTYPSAQVKLLLDKQATRAEICNALRALSLQCNEDSTVLLYISSHGGRITEGESADEYLLPVDVDGDSLKAFARTAISGQEFTRLLRAIPARKLVLILDCCHAGGIGQPKNMDNHVIKAGFSENYYDILKAGQGRVILASSRSTEQSYILPGAKNSLFTQHLLDGLKGGAIGSGGVIRILDLFNYLQPKVTEAQANQHPLLKAEIEENFPIALYPGGKSSAIVPAEAPLDDGYQYDVFISYRTQAEKPWSRKALLPYEQWVCDTLLPALEQKGVRVAIDFRFPFGKPVIMAMEEAIQRSRYTLVVLAPAPVAGGQYTKFESLLAQHIGMKHSRYRLLPIIREACTPRLGLDILFMLDMTDDDEFTINLERLLYQLQQSPAQN
ncbi:MAG: TIR domain-containing protein [Gammaproteobacteria bacterium]|nr:TIR domain-containing protein [Gammaproteobacteria bacterium]